MIMWTKNIDKNYITTAVHQKSFNFWPNFSAFCLLDTKLAAKYKITRITTSIKAKLTKKVFIKFKKRRNSEIFFKI